MIRGARSLRLLLGLVAATACLVAACSDSEPTRGAPGAAATPKATATSAAAPSATATPEYVGGAVCAECHPSQAEAWDGSHHDLAMQVATPETVLGDFDGATFEHGGVTSTFSRDGDRFVVRTDGRDGELADFEIAYTFGVDPLQQYLIGFPDGRVQALGIAWDSRPADQGGQRWYPLYPDERLGPDDPLHWTSLQQNWNHMCAECHSTRLRKGYDEARDRFDTTWSEIDVSCEACHGPGSRHVESARAGATGDGVEALPVAFGEATRWSFAPGAAIAHAVDANASSSEIETCGRCHARRAQLVEADPSTDPLLASHRTSLIERDLYHVDGQILDEVYVYGSFRQSRMHEAGVRCRDCHDPHSLEPVAEGGSDAVCGSCHRPEVFAAESHHHHPVDSEGARCAGCHMPTRTYMGVDVRHDHSFRVPRPDLTRSLGTPNACNACHADRDATWAAAALERWDADSRAGTPHFGHALRDARVRRGGAAEALAAIADDRAEPAIVRATALMELGSVGAHRYEAVVERALGDADPLVRMGALGASATLDPRIHLRNAAPLLRDPVLAVRLEASLSLRGVPPEAWKPADRSALARVQGEWRDVQRTHADRPESWVNLGNLEASHGNLDGAREAYERALVLAPSFLAAWFNLADLERQVGNDAAGEEHLRRAAAIAPDNGDVQHALGLLQIRQGRRDEAIRTLGRAALLSPEQPRYALVYALALEDAGRTGEAVVTLERSLDRFPDDGETLFTLATWARDRGDWEEAIGHARRLVEVTGGDPGARELLASFEAASQR